MKTLRSLKIALSIVVAMATTASAQTTRSVPSQFPSIQAAIDAAAAGDIVEVGPGTWLENIDFRGLSITVRSTAGRAATTIDGNQVGTVVTMTSGEGAGTRLEGFTITNGLSGLAGSTAEGGGLLLQASEAIIVDCHVLSNAANGSGSTGGGVLARDGKYRFERCRFELNTTKGTTASGGGLAAEGCELELIDSQFISNDCMGTVRADGGGVAMRGCVAAMRDCEVRGNTISGQFSQSGAGVAFDSSPGRLRVPTLEMTDSAITGNTLAGGGVASGAGMFIAGSDTGSPAACIERCVLADNVSLAVVANGSGLWVSTSRVVGMGSCIVVGNDGLSGSSAMECSTSTTEVLLALSHVTVVDNGTHGVRGAAVALTNCIVREHSVANLEGGCRADHCIIQGGYTKGSSILDVDPQFRDRSGRDFRLAAHSPAIDTGTALFATGIMQPRTDFDGQPRALGSGLDIGADEAPSPTPTFLSQTPCGASFDLLVGQPLELEIEAGTFSELPGNAVTLAADPANNPAAMISPALPLSMTGAGATVATTLNWTPSVSEVGQTTFRFIATSGTGETADCVIQIRVAPPAPQFGPGTPCGQVLVANGSGQVTFNVDASALTNLPGNQIVLTAPTAPPGTIFTPSLPLVVSGDPATASVTVDWQSISGTSELAIFDFLATDQIGSTRRCRVRVAPMSAAILRVPVDQPTIQSAIAAAVPGEIVLVAPGIYMENIDFLGKDLIVASEGGPEVTTIDGGEAGTVVTIQSGESRAAVLQGFRITGGSGTVAGSEEQGGGILVMQSSPTVADCLIENNSIHATTGTGISRGAGAACIGGGARFSLCVFRNNQLSGSECHGGGLFALDATVEIDNCRVLANTSSQSLSATGGGLACQGGQLLLSNSVIQGNDVGGLFGSYGGGIAIRDSLTSVAQATVEDSVFAENFSSSGFVANGIGAWINGETRQGQVTFSRCQWRSNFAGSSAIPIGSAIYVRHVPVLVENCNVVMHPRGLVGKGSAVAVGPGGSALTLVHCTVAHNETGGLSGAVSFRNGILWGNTGPEFTVADDISFSIIEGGGPYATIYDENPGFVDPVGGDFHLMPASLATDRASGESSMPADPLVLDIDGEFRWQGAAPDLGSDEVPSEAPYLRGFDCGVPVQLTVGDPIVLPIEAGSITGSASPSLAVTSGALPAGAMHAPMLPMSVQGALPTLTWDFVWTPTVSDVGTHHVSYSATNELGLVTTCVLTLTVNNRPHFLPATPCGQTVIATAGSPLSIPIQATSFRLPSTSTLQLTSSPPPGLATFVPPLPLMAMGSLPQVATSLEWTPTESDVGSYRIDFVVTDGEGFSSSCTITIQVNAQPRFIGSTPCGQVLGAAVGRPLTFNVAAEARTGSASNSLSLTVSGSPSGALFSPALPLTSPLGTGSAATTFSWTPSLVDLGTHTLIFTATDQTGAAATCMVEIDVDQPPVFQGSSPCGQSVMIPVGTTQRLEFSVLMPEGGQVDMTGLPRLSLVPANLPRTASAGETVDLAIDWTAIAFDLGTHQVEVFAVGPTGVTSRCSVTVAIPLPPFFSGGSQCGRTVLHRFETQHQIDFEAMLTNPAATSLTLDLVTAPQGAVFTPALPLTTMGSASPASSSMLWTPTISQGGTHSIVVTATDGLGSITTCNVQVIVSNGPRFVQPATCGASQSIPVSQIFTQTFEVHSDVGATLSMQTPSVAGASFFPSLPLTIPAGGSVTTTFSWLPTLGQTGNTETFALEATDTMGLTTNCSLTLTVGSGPMFIAPSPCSRTLTVPTLTPITREYFVQPTNPGEQVTLDAITMPPGVVSNPPLPITGAPGALVSATLSWTPGIADVGANRIEMGATNSIGAVTRCLSIINVDARNPDISFTPSRVLTVVQGTQHTVDITAIANSGQSPESVELSLVSVSNPSAVSLSFSPSLPLTVAGPAATASTQLIIDVDPNAPAGPDVDITLMATSQTGASTTVDLVLRVRFPGECFLLAGSAPTLSPLAEGDFLLNPADLLIMPVLGERNPEFYIPSTPSLQGLTLYAQVVMYNPVLFPNDPLQLSNGLEIRFGESCEPYGDGGSPLRLWAHGNGSPGTWLGIRFGIPAN